MFLDIACGRGGVLREANRLGLKTYGVDISESAVQVAQKWASGAQIVVSDGEKLPFPDNCFDYVTNIGSLEHYINPEIGIQEIARVLRPGGKACIHLPNLFSLFWNIDHVRRTGGLSVDEQPIQRYATRNEWRDLLEENGLQIYRTVKHVRTLPTTWHDLFWYLRHPKNLMFLLLTPLVPLNLANSLVFLGRPTPLSNKGCKS